MLLPLAAIIVVALAGVQVRADTCPTSFLVHPNGNKDYCLTIDEVHTPNSRAYVRRCAAPPAFGQVWYFMPFPRNAGYFLRNLIAGTNNLCLNAEVYRIESPYNGRQLAITTCYNDGANDWKQNGRHQIELGALVDGRKSCMDLRDGNVNGGAVQIWYCDEGGNNPNQRWDIVAHEY